MIVRFAVRPLLLLCVVALLPLPTQAGGSPPLSQDILPDCAHRPLYEASLISGAGPFTPPNDPYVPHPATPRLSYNFLNTGIAIPHLVLSVDSRGSFTAGRVGSSINTGHGLLYPRFRLVSHSGSIWVWDFGPLPAGSEELIHVAMKLKRHCCYTALMRAFGNVDRYGNPIPSTAIAGAGGGMSGSSSSTAVPTARKSLDLHQASPASDGRIMP